MRPRIRSTPCRIEPRTRVPAAPPAPARPVRAVRSPPRAPVAAAAAEMDDAALTVLVENHRRFLAFVERR